jgi:hypothetical protein
MIAAPWKIDMTDDAMAMPNGRARFTLRFQKNDRKVYG